MEWRHDVETKDLNKASAAEITEALIVQERELEMEGYIRGAELKAMQERRMLNSLLDSVQDSVISTDPRGTISRFNNAAEKQFGWSRKEVLENNINIKEMMPMRFAVDHDDYLYNYLSTGNQKLVGKKGLKAFGLRRDDSEFPIYLTVGEVIDDGFHLFTGIVRDLTEDVKKERMREAEDDCVHQMIWKTNATGQAETVSKLFKEYTGLNDATIRKFNVFGANSVHKADYAVALAQFKDGCKRKDSFDVKRRLKSTEGTYKWYHTRASPIFKKDGSLQSWCGSETDIDEMERQKYEVKMLPDCLPVGFWKADPNGDVETSNKQFQDYLGVSSQDKVNAFAESIVHPDDISASKAALKKGVSSKEPFEMQSRLKGADGEYNWFVTRISPIMDFDENVISLYGTCTDINNARETQEELLVLPESLKLCIWKISPRGDILYANKSFKDFVGIKEDDSVNVFSEKVSTRLILSFLGYSQGGYQEFSHRLHESKQGQNGVPDRKSNQEGRWDVSEVQ
jgi:PAS domain S-box-containing protein